MMTCPKCGATMTHEEAEPDTNVPGGWACDNEGCDVFIHDSEIDHSDELYDP
jgi:hypothetical protein